MNADRSLARRALGRYYRWASQRFCRRPLRVSPPRPIVSFSFDDFPRTAASEGGRVLAELDLRATYFVAFGLAGEETSGGRAFSLDDLHEVVRRGHEIGCHTFGHELSQRVRSRDYEASLERNRERLRELHIHAPWRVFAYPAGSVTPATKRIVQKRFLGGRGTWPGLNAGWADANLLRANSLYSGQRPVHHHVALIEEAVAQNGWLIFYTHDVQENPARFGCTPDYLRQVARAALDRGADVLPIGEALEQLQAGAADSLPLTVPAVQPAGTL